MGTRVQAKTRKHARAHRARTHMHYRDTGEKLQVLDGTKRLQLFAVRVVAI